MTRVVTVQMGEYGGRVVSPAMFTDLGLGEAVFTTGDDILRAEFAADLTESAAAAVHDRLTSANDNEAELRSRLLEALDANRTYLGQPSTDAQARAQVKALTRQNNALIRLVLRRLDGTE